MRKANFEFMESEINRFNTANSTSVHGHNWTSDLSREEYRAMLSLKNMPKPDTSKYATFNKTSNALPTTVNWCTAGKCNPVKN